MEDSARIFNCARCRTQVVICRRCDRGNIYCGVRCSQPARDESLRAAGRRYQSGRQGRFRHAERQRRYRLCRRKVTHQGSTVSRPHDLLSSKAKVADANSTVWDQGMRCDFCNRPCSSFVRLDFLHRSGPRLMRAPWVRP